MQEYINRINYIAMPNKYTKWYCDIILNANKRATSKRQAQSILGYVELHHILPKSFKLGGEKDKKNYAYLSAKEHLVCHLLLIRMFESHQKAKMCFALNSMRLIQARNGKIKLTSHHYQIIKKYYAWARQQTPGHMAGKKHSLETIEKIKKNTKNTHKGQKAWNKGLTKENPDVAAMYQNRKPNNTWQKNFQKTPEKEKRRLQTICKPVSIDGTIYVSAKEACRQIGTLKYITLIKRIKSSSFPTYQWI